MFQIAGPLLIQYVVSHGANMAGTAYVGHLEEPVLLSAMVLGGSLSMATGYHVVSGLASASETLSGQVGAHGLGLWGRVGGWGCGGAWGFRV